MMKKILLVLFCIVINTYALEIGKKLVNAKLQGDNGGYLNGKV